MMRRIAFFLVLAFAGLAALAGCTTQEGRVETSGGPGQRPEYPPEPVTPGRQPPVFAPPITAPPAAPLVSYPRSIQDFHTLPAVLSLYRQAQTARSSGHADQAKAELERALHIEPRNPWVWQALAGTELDLRDPEQAEQAANKSTSLARGNPFIEGGNWRLVASARQAQGDSAGALEAQARADGIDRMLARPAP
jgi:tetratricopeptide (TPR) repeat protein